MDLFTNAFSTTSSHQVKPLHTPVLDDKIQWIGLSKGSGNSKNGWDEYSEKTFMEQLKHKIPGLAQFVNRTECALFNY